MNMLSTWFAEPFLLMALLALPIAVVLMVYGHVRRVQAQKGLGSALLARRLVLVRPSIRRWRTLCILASLVLIALACAGPQWGQDPGARHRKGRDVLLVLDLSRSMNAEQPSRRELAFRAVRHLADAFEQHGAHRVSLTGFAAKAHAFFPLTQDYDHLRHTLAQIEAGDLPALKDDGAASGTRIGAALKLAVESCDPKRVNRPVILLLSDGDDPAGDDEWKAGTQLARTKEIRIHTIGFGDPDRSHTISLGRELVQFGDEPVRTRLNEALLRDIANRTAGIYLPARRATFPLGLYVQYLLDADELREETITDESVPIYQLRYAWLLLPGVLLIMLALVLQEGPLPRVKAAGTPVQDRWRLNVGARAVQVLLLLAAILCVSAVEPPAAESLLRQGNEAFEQGDFARAVRYFDQAERLTRDPGLVSFNKAAAHYRLAESMQAEAPERAGHNKEAIESYRRCLEDDQAPPERRMRAWFDLGNALAQFAGDNARTLAEAVAAYRACLQQPGLSASMRADARHNLELAQLRWLKARQKEPPETSATPPAPRKDPFETRDPRNSDETYVPVDLTRRQKMIETPDAPSGQKSKYAYAGAIQVLSDAEKLDSLSPEDALRTLESQARRIAAERRRQRNPESSAILNSKDW